jgi:hypothetical protein
MEFEPVCGETSGNFHENTGNGANSWQLRTLPARLYGCHLGSPRRVGTIRGFQVNACNAKPQLRRNHLAHTSLYECCRRLGRTGSWKQGRMRPQYTQPQQFRHSTPETGQIASETGYPAGLCETASVPWANLQGLLGCLLWGQHWSSPGVGKLSLEILRIKLCYTAPEQVPHCDECHCQREVLKTLNEATGRPPATSSLQFEIGWWVPLHTSIRQLSIEGIETAPRATTSPFQTACVGLTL